VLGAKLRNSRVLPNPDGTLTLEVLELFKDRVSEPQTLANLSEATLTFFSNPFQWKVELRATPPADSPDTAKRRRSRVNHTRLVMEHPVFQDALEILGGELLDIKPLQTDSG